MKTFLTLLIISLSTFAQSQSIKEAWQPLLDQEQIAVYFTGMWESLGINIEETKEAITVIHKGDHFELKDGVDPLAVDYNVFLTEAHIGRMLNHGKDGEIDAYESFKIMGALFTPFTRSSLTHPMMNKSFQMKLAKIENHVHVYLNSPTNDEYVAHTLLFMNKKWMVVDGIQGDAKRVFTITPEQAIEYQRAAFTAQKGDSKKSWRAFKKFYLNWRATVSEVLD
ncbi:MAG: hypothetical protein GQ574_08235 [Crocinitomix sp.]|nr:hypothetical protein [Crocinitomix sp.]